MKYLLFIVVLLSALALVDFSLAQGNTRNSRCIDKICQKLGAFHCDSEQELSDIARACQTPKLSFPCFEKICANVGPFEQDTWPKLKSYLLSCKNNYEGRCLDFYQSKLGFFDLDEPSEWIHAAESCQKVNTACLENLCSRLGFFACDSMTKLDAQAQNCRRP